jgi:hypothetical protein
MEKNAVVQDLRAQSRDINNRMLVASAEVQELTVDREAHLKTCRFQSFVDVHGAAETLSLRLVPGWSRGCNTYCPAKYQWTPPRMRSQRILGGLSYPCQLYPSWRARKPCLVELRHWHCHYGGDGMRMAKCEMQELQGHRCSSS